MYENIKDAVLEAEQAAEDSYITIDEAIADVNTLYTLLHFQICILFADIIFSFSSFHLLQFFKHMSLGCR